MALAIDGSVHLNNGSAHSVSLSLTTSNAGDYICVLIECNAGPVTSVVGSSVGNFYCAGKYNGGSQPEEFWVAMAPSALTSETITVTQNGTGFITVDAFGVSGSGSSTPTFDGPVLNNSTDPISITTHAANTIVIGGFRTTGTGSGFTAISSANFHLAEYKILTSAQTVSVSTASAGSSNGGVAFAIPLFVAGQTLAPSLLSDTDTFYAPTVTRFAPVVTDGNAHNNTSTSSCAVTLTTTQANDYILVFVETNAGPITGVSGSSLGSFTRFAQQSATGAQYEELWAKFAPNALTSEVITATNTGSGFITVDAVAVAGTNQSSLIFDGSVQTAAVDPISITTHIVDTLVVASFRCQTSTPTAGTGFKQISGADYHLLEFKNLAATQTLSCVMGLGAGNANASIAVAIPYTSVYIPPPPTNKGGNQNNGKGGGANKGGQPPKPASVFDPYGRYATYYELRNEQDSIRRRRMRAAAVLGAVAQTYNNSIALNLVAALSPALGNVINSSAALNVVAAAVASPDISINTAAALNVVAALSSDSIGSLNNAAAINLIIATAAAAGQTFDNAAALNVIAALAPSVTNAMDQTIVLNVVNALTAGNVLALSPSAAIGLYLGKAAASQLAANAASNINIVGAVSGTAGEDLQAALTLNAVAGVSSSSTLTAQAAAMLTAIVANAAAATMDAQAAITLNAVARSLVGTGQDFDESASINTVMRQLTQASLDLQQSATVNIVTAAQAGVSTTIEGSISLAALAGIAPLGGIDLDSSATISVKLAADNGASLDAAAIAEIMASFAVVHTHLNAPEPIGDITVLQGVFDTTLILSGTFETASDLGGTYEITVVIDGRTLN